MDQELSDRLAQLEAEVTRLREAPAHAPGRQRAGSSTRWRRFGALGSVLAVVAVGLVASAGAAPTTDTTAVAFVSIPPKKVMNANTINPGATESAVVIGGTTTVPSNATTVRLEVTVKGTAAGTITLFPAGNEAGGAGHTVSWAAGGTTTATKAENVGLSNKVSVKNSSTKAAVVTLTITGYSTQVTAGDINSSGGTTGQVLTDTGDGATWKTPSAATRSAYSATSEVTSFVIDQTLRSVTIHAPEDGFIVIQASAIALKNFAGCSDCVAHARISKAGGSSSSDVVASMPAGGNFTQVSPMWTVPVAQGSHTFDLRVGDYPNNSAIFYNGQIQAVFVPDGATGAVSSTRSRADTKSGPGGTRILR